MGKFMQNNVNICSITIKLYPKFIKIRVGHRRLLETTRAFEGVTSLPKKWGAINTTHVHLHNNPNPNTNHNFYHCRYGYISLLLHIVSNHKKIIWDVCVKAPSGTDESTHFCDSLLYNRLTSVWRRVGQGHQCPRPPHPPLRRRGWCFPLCYLCLHCFCRVECGLLPKTCSMECSWREGLLLWKPLHFSREGLLLWNPLHFSVLSSLLEARLFLCSFISIFLIIVITIWNLKRTKYI